MCENNENTCQEITEAVDNERQGFKFSLDSFLIKPPSPSPSPLNSLPSTSNLRFTSHGDLGKLFALQGNGVAFENTTIASEQVEQQPLFRKIARPIPPSLNTNLTQLIMSHNNGNYNSNFAASPYQSDSPDDTSGHRRRDSNVSAMSIQLYDVVGSGHQRRDSNVSNMSMQLDTPTPSSGTESGNEEESKLACFPFTFTQKSLTMSRPSTPTTPPPPSHPTNFCSTPATRTSVSSLVTHPQRMRRMSLDISMETGCLSEGRNEKQSPIHRAVRARRASLLPKTKSFQRVANELQEESRPIETEIKQEYKTTKVLKNELDCIMDTGKLTEEFLNNWIKIRDIQPSPPPYAASKLNPEIELSFRQDTPSPTSTAGSCPISSRIKRKASDDRFEPYFNPKRRAVSPSLVGSPPVASSVPSPPVSSYSSGAVGPSSSYLTSRGQVKGNSNLANIHDANGSFSRMNLNGE
ncbi:18191_t:CDS:2 [Acaulospora morrowiae]|uniref:18191_t:CDS:1 n=1 Tax=Acaulospora morrowiae TaxID=94023 RepID=A0A9N9EJ52_9GLOM|nr:18191_t:CDS:2 [Acaulospora morrowiae]